MSDPAPPAPPDPSRRYHVARSFYESLMKSQWLPTERIIAWQERQLQQMLAHAHAQVPFYAEPLGRIRRTDGSFDLSRWEELPIISREVVEADWDAFQAKELPPGHEEVLDLKTSGSEGKSFPMRKTRFDHTGMACASFRYAAWFGYDFAVPLAMIRAGFIRPYSADDPEDRLWGPPWLDPATRGARHRLHIATAIDAQLDWLSGLGRVILNTLPSNAMALAQRSEERGLTLAIAGVMTVGERLSQDVRDEVRRIWNCRISDVYSTAETGLVAIECPDTGLYHLQPELSRVEIISADGGTCPPGKAGNLVATALYNFAMPLIRYRFQDLVVPGLPCACGRGLPALSNVLGRKANLFERADGSFYLPDISTPRVRELTGARLWQIEQEAVDGFKVRLKLPAMPDKQAVAALARHLRTILGSDSRLAFEAVADIQRTPGGKFYPFRRQQQVRGRT